MMATGPRAGAVTSIGPGSPPATIGPVAVANLRVGAGLSEAAGLDDGHLAIPASEADEENDLNGDGDQTDTVLEIWDPATGRLTDTGLAAGIVVPAGGGRAAFSAYDRSRETGTSTATATPPTPSPTSGTTPPARPPTWGSQCRASWCSWPGARSPSRLSEAWSGNQDFQR